MIMANHKIDRYERYIAVKRSNITGIVEFKTFTHKNALMRYLNNCTSLDSIDIFTYDSVYRTMREGVKI